MPGIPGLIQGYCYESQVKSNIDISIFEKLRLWTVTIFSREILHGRLHIAQVA
jgi:hypothetical protein